MLLDEIVDKVWEENWNIIRASKAYKKGYPLKLAKPMIEYLFKSAMFRFYEMLKQEGDYVLIPQEVAETLVWNHVWRVECKDCGEIADYDAVGFLHYLNNGKKCDACGSKNTSWRLLLGDEEEESYPIKCWRCKNLSYLVGYGMIVFVCKVTGDVIAYRKENAKDIKYLFMREPCRLKNFEEVDVDAQKA